MLARSSSSYRVHYASNAVQPVLDAFISSIIIEGFHDAVHTLYALRPGAMWIFFLDNKICFNFVSILFEKIKLTVSERTYIIVPMV